jgi:hypothetical protein
LSGLIKTKGVSFLEMLDLKLEERRHLISVKPLDFSKPSLVRDFGEVMRMFKEDGRLQGSQPDGHEKAEPLGDSAGSLTIELIS